MSFAALGIGWSGWKPRGINCGRKGMKIRLGTLFMTSAVLIGPAMAQNAGPNPGQVAAKALLQAADKAIGASSVKSFTEAATGWMGYPGQQFATADLPRSDLKS